MSDTRPNDITPDPEDDWDANDPRRQTDCFAPPMEPCECYCLHCQRVFMSDQIWLQKVVNGREGFDGFWMCPTPNCDGKGFTFDIFPTDPAHPANAGWVYWDDDDEFDDEEWDPDETRFKELDKEFGDEDDDIEGEEWKYGLEPGQQLPEPEWVEEAQREWEEDQARYDQPDERPREIEWDEGDGPTSMREDDIPF